MESFLQLITISNVVRIEMDSVENSERRFILGYGLSMHYVRVAECGHANRKVLQLFVASVRYEVLVSYATKLGML